MSATPVAFEDWFAARARHVETVLDQALPEASLVPPVLHQAMRYATLGGGKRVRAVLVYAAGEASLPPETPVSAQEIALDQAAAAVELVHAYSLVHDDLPCMDGDTLRRGQPTVHVRFGEAVALLVGDALQPLAFDLLSQMPVAPALIAQATQILARAAGSQGMAGGQAIDCTSVGRTLTSEELQVMHAMKTGAMLEASVLLGGVVAGASSTVRQGLEDYAAAIGLAFQVVDDILDVTADTATLGKTAGKDAAVDKPTYVSVLGVTRSRELLESLRAQAHDALRPLGSASHRLAEVADFIVGRDH